MDEQKLAKMELRLEKKIEQLIEGISYKDDAKYVGIRKDLDYILQDIREIKKTIAENYVTRAEFTPIQKIVYGLVSLVMVTVFGAIMTLVVK